MNRAVMRFVFVYYAYCACRLYQYNQQLLEKAGVLLRGRAIWAPVKKWHRHFLRMAEQARDNEMAMARGMVAYVRMMLFQQQRQLAAVQLKAVQAKYGAGPQLKVKQALVY
jgi:hypothetical protein